MDESTALGVLPALAVGVIFCPSSALWNRSNTASILGVLRADSLESDGMTELGIGYAWTLSSSEINHKYSVDCESLQMRMRTVKNQHTCYKQ